MGVLTERTNLRDATVPGGTDEQRAMGVLTEGTNLRDATVPGGTDNQNAMGVLTEGTNPRDDTVIDAASGVVSSRNIMVMMHVMTMHMIGLGVGREGQANRSHDC
jgi:hypothetical protein